MDHLARLEAQVADHNRTLLPDLQSAYQALGANLARADIDIDRITLLVQSFKMAIPSWGVGVGGTRFARFPIAGEPRNVDEKLQDCAVIQRLVRCTPLVSLHFPWDKAADFRTLKQLGDSLGLGFDAVNSNTFQDPPGQTLSYKFGSLSHSDAAVRDLAIAHNIECIHHGEQLGSKALTVWIADGANFPGQQHMRKALDRYLDSMAKIYAALPADWTLLLEHKLYEPAFYATVIADWGTSFACAQMLGEKARCLVDLGHHAPTTNIEMIVARLIQFSKLGGFHFNDSKYGDDDLDSGSIDPFRLFLVFNELVDADSAGILAPPAYMMDQSHNITDPIESLMMSSREILRAYAQALLVDRPALHAHQDSNDVVMAVETLRKGFQTDVGPILAMARYRLGGAIDPVGAYRHSGYRAKMTELRPKAMIAGAGIV
ncbi:L-rhamnose catabolism isomerase [Ferrovibrio terrae]|uniref:L-rhamnose catabolism isomerase n=1 Tax=Ferrovibrio terrae TaxID=2594003 RepID=UPI0031380442